MTELVDAEYERLVRASADLKHEYGQLRERPSDYEAHEHHHAKVLSHIVALRAYIGHLRDRNPQT